MYNNTKNSIFLGIDVHKRTYSVTAVCDGTVIKRDQLPATGEALLAYCQRYFPSSTIYSCYEAGFSGFSLHKFLISNGINNIVIHAADVEIAANDRVKTDKRDSLKLAIQLYTNRLRGIFVPSEKMQEDRSITRLRESWVKEKIRITCKIKGFLYYHGINFNSARMSLKLIKKLRLLNFSPEIKYCLEELFSAWLFMKERIESCDQKLEEKEQDNEIIRIYKSAPGIGTTTAHILANELGDMSQFSNEKHLYSYCGLTPCEYSSGDNIRRGHISRQGKSLIRKCLTQCAWVAIRKDISLKEAFDRISIRAGGKRAIQAIARKLIGRLRACQKNKCYYEIGKSETIKQNPRCYDLVQVSCG